MKIRIDLYKLYQLIGGILQYCTLAIFIYILLGVAIWISRDVWHMSINSGWRTIAIVLVIGMMSAVVDFIKGKLP